MAIALTDISTSTGSISSSCTSMQGGVVAVTGVSTNSGISYTGTDPPGPGSLFTVTFQDTSGGAQIQVGAGNATGIAATFCMTYADKEYVLAGSRVYMSKVDDPTVWNAPAQTPSIGNAYIDLTKWLSNPEDIVAIAPYQGFLAFLSRHTCQIWRINADPAQWSIQQAPSNVGTNAAGSVQPLGELDILFLSDSGFRSLRVRDSSLYAYIDDIGSAVDSLAVASILGTPSGLTGVCSVVEPQSSRYWCFLNGTIWVLSRFLSSSVQAWSQYDTKYMVGGSMSQSFTPTKFVVLNGQVFCRDQATSSQIYQYGGPDGKTYDKTQVTASLPYLDFGKPGTRKGGKGISIACSGKWFYQVGCDPPTDTLASQDSVADSTFDRGKYPSSWEGTHVLANFLSDPTSVANAVLSAVIMHYEERDEV